MSLQKKGAFFARFESVFVVPRRGKGGAEGAFLIRRGRRGEGVDATTSLFAQITFAQAFAFESRILELPLVFGANDFTRLVFAAIGVDEDLGHDDGDFDARWPSRIVGVEVVGRALDDDGGASDVIDAGGGARIASGAVDQSAANAVGQGVGDLAHDGLWVHADDAAGLSFVEDFETPIAPFFDAKGQKTVSLAQKYRSPGPGVDHHLMRVIGHALRSADLEAFLLRDDAGDIPIDLPHHAFFIGSEQSLSMRTAAGQHRHLIGLNGTRKGHTTY